jgi:hypothetical protein
MSGTIAKILPLTTFLNAKSVSFKNGAITIARHLHLPGASAKAPITRPSWWPIRAVV